MRQTEVRIPPRTEFGVAAVTTVALVGLFWFVERELLWMSAVLLVGIWASLAVRRQEAARLPWLALGIVLLTAAVVTIWLI